MDEQQWDGVFSCGPFMDKMDFQPFNNGRVVAESVKDLAPCPSLGQAPRVE